MYNITITPNKQQKLSFRGITPQANIKSPLISDLEQSLRTMARIVYDKVPERGAFARIAQKVVNKDPKVFTKNITLSIEQTAQEGGKRSLDTKSFGLRVHSFDDTVSSPEPLLMGTKNDILKMLNDPKTPEVLFNKIKSIAQDLLEA